MQGAVTSMLLCSLYLAQLERQHLLPAIPSWQPHHHMLQPPGHNREHGIGGAGGMEAVQAPGAVIASLSTAGLTDLAVAAGSLRTTQVTGCVTPRHLTLTGPPALSHSRHSPGSHGRGGTASLRGSRSVLDNSPGTVGGRVAGSTGDGTPGQTQGGSVRRSARRTSSSVAAGAGPDMALPPSGGPSSMQVSPAGGAGSGDGGRADAGPASMDVSPCGPGADGRGCAGASQAAAGRPIAAEAGNTAGTHTQGPASAPNAGVGAEGALGILRPPAASGDADMGGLDSNGQDMHDQDLNGPDTYGPDTNGPGAAMDWLPSCHTPSLQLQLAQRPPDLAPTGEGGGLPRPTPSCWKLPRSLPQVTPWGPSIPTYPSTGHTLPLAQRMPLGSPAAAFRLTPGLQLMGGGEQVGGGRSPAGTPQLGFGGGSEPAADAGGMVEDDEGAVGVGAAGTATDAVARTPIGMQEGGPEQLPWEGPRHVPHGQRQGVSQQHPGHLFDAGRNSATLVSDSVPQPAAWLPFSCAGRRVVLI